MEYIICSAIHITDGNKHSDQPTNIDTGFVISGRRHNNCYSVLKCLLGKEGMDKLLEERNQTRDDQGFITNMNRYVNRFEGFEIAKKANQLLNANLYSDNTINILTSECIFPTDWKNFNY